MTSPMSSNPTWLPVAFRDTALTVATLGGQGHAAQSSFDTLRQRCRNQIQRLRAELKMAGQPDDVIQDAVYAQCALLDEAALNHLKGQDRDAWEREPLQVVEFCTHDAGDALIARMQLRLHQPQSIQPLLAIFLAVLSLGFSGRFALEGQDRRAAMMRALRERLGAPAEAPGGVVVRMATRWRGFVPPSQPICALASIVLAAGIWVLLDRWLGAAAAQLLR